MRRKAALTLLLTSFLILPAAASADGGYYGSGHESAKSADGYFGSGHKDGGTIVTSGGVRAWGVVLLRTLLRLPLLPR